jgi:hypothetical protein
LKIVVVDRSEQIATIPLGPLIWESIAFQGDEALLLLWGDALVRHELTTDPAIPDTLWRGDASRGGGIFENGRAIVVQDEAAVVHLVELPEGRVSTLGPTSGGGAAITTNAYDASLGLVAVGGWWDTLDVFSTRTGEHWRLPVGVGERLRTESIGFDAAGRWLICDVSTRIIAWTLPLDPIFTDLTTAEMLARTRELTNVRVVPDASEERGFRITSVQALAAP